MLRKSYLFCLFLIQLVVGFPQVEIKEPNLWYKAIRTENIEVLNGLIANQPEAVNGFLDEKQKVCPLIFAIEKGKENIVDLLLFKGANPNRIINGDKPLNLAIRRLQYHSARSLLDAGADPNAVDEDEIYPLSVSTRALSLRMTKMLVEGGASLLISDKKGRVYSDKVSRIDAPQLSNYLESMENRQRKLKTLPNMTDGPYITTDSSSIVAFSLESDSIKGTARKIYHRVNNNILNCNSQKNLFIGDDHSTVTKIVNLNGFDKTIVVGDVHGQFSTLIHLLKSATVIDDSLNWSFDNNCLVFVGDILDRGDQVTECLWLIHRLGLQSKRVGGKVIYLMGNHEELVLLGDNSYVNEKYCHLLNYFGLKITDVFAQNTFFGDWLRKLPVAVTIGNTLITHAGISREMAQMNMSVKQIDSILFSFFNSPAHQPNPLESLVLMDEGPLWTRQYFSEFSSKEPLDSSTIRGILGKLNAKTMIIGHTEVSTIDPIFEKQVIPINVPFNSAFKSGELLLIEKDSAFYKIKYNGEKELLFIRN